MKWCLGLAILFISVSMGTCLQTTVLSSWNGGFNGQFTISGPISGGWTVTLTFDQDLTSFNPYNADFTATSSRVYILKSRTHNANIAANTQLTLGFSASMSGSGGSIATYDQPTPPASTTAPDPPEANQCSCNYRIEEENSWDTGLNAKVVIPLNTQITSGWTLFLRFSHQVTSLNFYDGINKGTQDGGYTYQIQNNAHDAVVSNELNEGFGISFPFGQKPAIYPYLVGQPSCDCVSGTSRTTTTKASTTVKTTTTEPPITTKPPTTTKAATTTKATTTEPQTTTKPPTTTKATTTKAATTTKTTTTKSTTTKPTQTDPACRVSQCTCGSTYKALNEWQDDAGSHVHGDFNVPVANAISDWDLMLQFSEPVVNLQIWNAVQVSSSADGTTYYLASQSYNNVLNAGNALSMDFIATYSGQQQPLWDAKLSNQPVCNVGDPSPTTKETTKAATQKPTSKTSAKQTTKTSNSGTIPPQGDMPYNYPEVLYKSILLYEAQRSGPLPSTQRVTWRKDSFVNDGSDNGLDLSGGWFDAGDYVKFGLPMAQSVTILAWGAIEFKDAYTAAGQMDWMRDCLKWATDYFLKCHTGPTEFYAQVGHGQTDHNYWGRPEDFTGYRPSYKVDASNPGSDVVGETAAALAAASIVFREEDGSYADTLLNSAKELYTFANDFRRVYHESVTDAAEFYPSSGYWDELAWAAAWLYYVTGDVQYLNDAESHYAQLSKPAWGFSWDEKTAGVQLLMYLLTEDNKYADDLEASLSIWLPNGGIPYTPKGLAYRIQWGANRYSANTAFLSLVRAKYIEDSADQYQHFATSQIHYMLGGAGRSFVVGFGVDPPTQPHHASSSCPDEPEPCTWDNFHAAGPNPQELTGALVGGPTSNDVFVDDRTDYIYNEVTCDYNAGFQSAVAGLYDLYLNGILPETGLEP